MAANLGLWREWGCSESSSAGNGRTVDPSGQFHTVGGTLKPKPSCRVLALRVGFGVLGEPSP